jgi:hypothetical protein
MNLPVRPGHAQYPLADRDSDVRGLDGHRKRTITCIGAHISSEFGEICTTIFNPQEERAGLTKPQQSQIDL